MTASQTIVQSTPVAAAAQAGASVDAQARVAAEGVRPFARLRIERALAAHFAIEDTALESLSLCVRNDERWSLDRVNGRAVVSAVLAAVGDVRVCGGRREHAWDSLDGRGDRGGGSVNGSTDVSWWLGLRVLVRFDGRPAWLSLAEWDSAARPLLGAAAFGLRLRPLAVDGDAGRWPLTVMEEANGHDRGAGRDVLERHVLLTRAGGVLRATVLLPDGWTWRPIGVRSMDRSLLTSAGLPAEAPMLGAHRLDGPMWLDVLAPVCVAGPSCAREWDGVFTAEDKEGAEKAVV